MDTYKSSGDTVTVTAPAGGVTSGVGVQIGALFGIPQASADEDEQFGLKTLGVHTLPRDDNDSAWSEGDRVYWDSSAGKATTAAVGNLPIGVAAADAVSAATEADVRLDGISSVPAAAEDTTIYDHADDVGGNVAIAAAEVARKVQIVAKVTETLAGSSTSPQFQVGYAGSLGTFLDVTSGDADDILLASGELPAGEDLLVTVTDGTGGAEAGKVQVSILAVA